jgi:hypothetical protein
MIRDGHPGGSIGAIVFEAAVIEGPIRLLLVGHEAAEAYDVPTRPIRLDLL